MPLEVELSVRERGALRPLQRTTLAAKKSRIAFSDLAPGTYSVITRGEGPLQQRAKTFEVGAGERRQGNVKIVPTVANVRVTLGGKPLPDATLEATNTDHGWKTTVRTDANGTAIEESWQPGSFAMSVRAPAMTAPYIHTASDWNITLPERRITGRVIDAANATPVSNAIVLLRTESDESSRIVQTTTDTDGRFVYRAVLAGKQTLEVRADHYVYPAPVTFELTGDNASRELELRVDSGAPAEVLVVDGSGLPLRGARLFSSVGDELRSMSVTADDGRAVVPLTANATSVLYVIPRDGSFAVVRTNAAQLERTGTLRIAVPSATGLLQLVTKRTDGAPVGGVRLLVRYNGELVPAEVVRALERTHGVRFATDDGGTATLPELPLGIYELWPYRTDNEAEALRASATTLAAPVQLTLKSGENVVRVSFAAK